MWGIVARFEDRASGDEALLAAWRAAKGPLDSGADGRPRSVRLAVAANALSLVGFDADDDVHDLQRITSDLGRRQVATLQDELLAAADTEAGRPLTTRLVRVLGERAWGHGARSAGTLTGGSADLRTLCAEAALELLMVGPRDAAAAPELASRRELLEAFATGDVLLWRRLVAVRPVRTSGRRPRRRRSAGSPYRSARCAGGHPSRRRAASAAAAPHRCSRTRRPPGP